MIFPYLREEIISKAIKSGIPQFVIKPMNFSQLYKDQTVNEKKEETD